MYTGQIDVISNRADWTSQFVQLIDGDDGSVINILNTEIGFDCIVSIREIDSGCYRHLVSTSIAEGGVIVAAGDTGPGFHWHFEQSALSCLDPGTYEFGIKVKANGEVEDLVIGTIAVLGGNYGNLS
jgi:hypothetical protein